MPEPEVLMANAHGRCRRRSGRIGACALALLVLGGGCVTSRSEEWDESAERIEEIIQPDSDSEPIPEGLAFAPPDVPTPSGPPPGEALPATPEELPLDEEEDLSGPSGHPLYPFAWGAPVAPCKAPPHGAILPAPVPLSCLLHPGAIRYRIEPRPGGSIPGLLP
ncbi:hypothetical protein ACLESO_32240 [Pyxidicoccus sp. 3LG]